MSPGSSPPELAGVPLDELESLDVPRDDPGIKHDVQRERREVDVPGFDQRIQERDAVLPGQMEDVRIEELEDDDAHLLEASAAEVRDHAKPVLVAQLFLGDAREHVQQPMGDQPLELAERLRLEDRADVLFPVRVALAEDQLADFPEQGRGLFSQLPLQFRPSAGPPPAAPAPRSAVSGTGPSCHRCRCGSEREAPSSGSGAGRCRTRSPGRRARARVAPGRTPPAAAESRTKRPWDCLLRRVA